ncbi:MAG: PEGA domain-containing protein [Deltaproteobacteria bacterium]|nr:PEGA domain-containing protein [Deltaproteobacteria bacterium]
MLEPVGQLKSINNHAKRRVICLAMLALLAVPNSATAQDDGTQGAKQSFDRGQALYLEARFQKAADAFLKAYAAKSFPAFLFNAAVCYEKNKSYAEALKYYKKFLFTAPHSPDAKLVKKRIATIGRHLSPSPAQPGSASQPAIPKMPELPPIQTKGVVVVESSPEGAAIYLKDKKSGIFTRTPFIGSLPPGRHTIILELKEFKPVRKTIHVRRDVLSYLFFSLARQRNLGWIEVRGNIPNANIYLDKQSFGAVGRTPYSGYLRPGKRKLIIARPGYKPFETDITVVAGKTHMVAYTLKRVQHGWLKVTGKTTRGAKVLVDGKRFACSDYPCRGKIDVGVHKVKIAREGYKNYETTVDVGVAHEVQVAVKLNPTPSRLSAYITFGVAAAVLGGGIAAGVIANSTESELQDLAGAGGIYESDDDRLLKGKVAAISANALYALSGVLTVLGVYYLLRDDGPPSYGESRDRKIAITPFLGPQAAGVSGMVRF